MRQTLSHCNYTVSLPQSRDAVALVTVVCTVLFAFAVYARTMAPTITLRDGGMTAAISSLPRSTWGCPIRRGIRCTR